MKIGLIKHFRLILLYYISNKNMYTKNQKSGSQQKKAAAQITKFNYHLQHTIPENFAEECKNKESTTQAKILSKKGIRGMTFYFMDYNTQGVDLLDAESILMSAKKIYLNKDSIKINDNMYKNYKPVKASFWPIYGEFHEII